MKRITVFFVAAALAVMSFAAFADPALSDAEADASAVTSCMKDAKSDNQVSTCILGLVALKAVGRGVTVAAAATVAPQVIVQKSENGRTAWDVFANMVTGVAQFAKEAFQTVAPVAAQVYVARTNAHTQEVVAGYNRDSTIAGYQAFTSMNAQTAAAGTYGYQYVQAPGAVTTSTSTLNGTGVVGSGTNTGPVTTTRTCNGGQAGNGAGTTTGAPGGAGGTATC